MNEILYKKLQILASSARYDVSCVSSGSTRKNQGKGLGNTVGCGICHSFTEDGRCVSLLKILMTNHCIYDCAYCVNRRTNDHPRTAFTAGEIVYLTVNFYQRNFIEGLFLSSGVIRNPDYTMEQMILVAKKLRIEERYNGYIHLKTIPGASPELVYQAGLFADRMSVNIEIPTEDQLLRLAPEKNYRGILTPMKQIGEEIVASREEHRKSKKAPLFSPAGQSTQLIIGATPESDRQILLLSSGLYKSFLLKRVYYSGYLPVNEYDKRLPALNHPPLAWENRLYQCDWLMRFYRFQAEEILDESQPFLDLDLDPKLAYAIRHPHLFPIDVNKADYEMILRIPGVGVKSAQMIIQARRFRKLTPFHLAKIGVVMKRAKYFVTCNEFPGISGNLHPLQLRKKILAETSSRWRQKSDPQLSLFDTNPLVLPPAH